MQVTPFGVTSAALSNPVNASETIVQTSPIVEVPRDSAIAIVNWSCSGQLGNTPTGVTFKLYRGSTLAGTLLLNTGSMTGGIGTNGQFIGFGGTFVDVLLLQATVQYSLS